MCTNRLCKGLEITVGKEQDLVKKKKKKKRERERERDWHGLSAFNRDILTHTVDPKKPLAGNVHKRPVTFFFSLSLIFFFFFF